MAERKMIGASLQTHEMLQQLQQFYKMKFKKYIAMGELIERFIANPLLLVELKKSFSNYNKNHE